ncbi:MAG: LacI family DNA-binding transcriptional regulator [Ornithinimicrobium sp.]
MRRPSIKDVAAQSGVSFQTVSKVLNGGGSVSRTTRRAILDAADQLGYLPDASARGLVTRRTQLLGVVVGDLADETLARFVVAVEREAKRLGYALAIVSVGAETAEAAETAETGETGEASQGMRHLPETTINEQSVLALLERRVDGILLAAPQLEEDDQLGRLLTENVPVVSLHSVPGGVASLIGSDHVEVGRLATQHLLDHGHRRIGVVAGPSSRRVSSARLRGHRAVMEAQAGDVENDLVEQGDWSPAGGAAATRRLLARRPDITALAVHNDLMAIGVLEALHDLGRPAPAGVAVVSVDNIPVAAHTIPPLTTVAIPFEETGSVAAATLVDLVEGRAVPERRHIPVSLRVRRSCGDHCA